VSLGALNGSSMVGWDNPLGVGRSGHRLIGSELTLELAPARPGLVRLDLAALNGSQLPQAGFSQGAIHDAEESRGGAVRFAAALPSQRARVEAGFTRTRFHNPVDPTLSQGAELVPVRPVTRNAHYVDASIRLLQGSTFIPARPSDVTLNFRHERVEPLFRSVAMPGVRADLLQNVIELTGSIGAATIQASHTRAHDNLERIGTILGTQTRSSGASIGLPLAALFGSGSAAWLPTVSYTMSRVHQFGDSVPQLGGFPVSFVPDQVSTNHVAVLQAQGRLWRVMLQLQRSGQDNRQPGRESADFDQSVNTLSFGLTPLPSIDVNVDLALENAHGRERDQDNMARRVGALLAWRAGLNSTLAAAVTATRITDEPRSNEQSIADLRFELTQRLRVFGMRAQQPPAQLFLRYARQFGEQLLIGQPGAARHSWSLNTGLTITVF
jgi:hypothetical protein